MSNVIQIKRGSGVPNGKLAPYELGIDISVDQLYFGGLFSGDKYGDARGIKVANAIQATQADKAKKIIANDGSELTVGTATTPIYLQNGEFKTCGGSSISGTIEKAEMLAESKYIGVNLELGTYTSFNGQQDIETGVTGILPINKGGTGAKDEETAAKKLKVLPLSGGTLTGALNLPWNRRLTDTPSVYGINCSNSDIIGVNGIYFQDAADASGEAINFAYQNAPLGQTFPPYWDSLYAVGGKLKFHPQRDLTTDLNGYEIYHTGNYHPGVIIDTLFSPEIAERDGITGDIINNNSVTIPRDVRGYKAFIFIASSDNSSSGGSFTTILPHSYINSVKVWAFLGNATDHKQFSVEIDQDNEATAHEGTGKMTLQGGAHAGEGIQANSLYVFGIK